MALASLQTQNFPLLTKQKVKETDKAGGRRVRAKLLLHVAAKHWRRRYWKLWAWLNSLLSQNINLKGNIQRRVLSMQISTKHITVAFFEFLPTQVAFCHCEISLESHGDLETIFMLKLTLFASAIEVARAHQGCTFPHCPRINNRRWHKNADGEPLKGIKTFYSTANSFAKGAIEKRHSNRSCLIQCITHPNKWWWLLFERSMKMARHHRLQLEFTLKLT